MFEKVLFPTDFSGYAQKTPDCIGEIPGVKEVVLLYVADAAHLSKRGLAFEPYIEDSNILEAKKKLEDIEKELSKAGLRVKAQVRVGNPQDKIISVAEEENVSLIIISTLGGVCSGNYY